MVVVHGKGWSTPNGTGMLYGQVTNNSLQNQGALNIKPTWNLCTEQQSCRKKLVKLDTGERGVFCKVLKGFSLESKVLVFV